MEGKSETYRRVDTLGKSQLDLILQVYDGAIKAFRTARAHYEQDESTAGYEEIERAKRFVTHLYTTLDMEKGGDVAANLSRLYVFVISQSYVIQATKDLAQLDAVTNIMSNLREGWRGLKAAEQGTAGDRTTATEETPVESGQFVTTA